MLRSVMRAKLMILAAAAAAATGGFWPLTADAQSPPHASRGQPSPEDVLSDLLAHASVAFDQGDFKEASDYYRAALKRNADREIACNLGIAARLTGNLVEAAQALAVCLAEPLPPDAEKDEKQRRIRYEADREVVRNQIGTIEIQTTPGAKVLLDEDAIGAAPLPTEVYVKPGSHTVVVEDKDRKASRSIFVGPGKRVALELTPEEPPKERRAAPASAPTKANGSRPLLLVGKIATGVALGTGLVAYGASRVVGTRASRDFGEARKEHPMGCSVPNPGGSCKGLSSTGEIAGTLQRIGVAGLITAAVLGGGTVIYRVATGLTVSTSSTSAVVGWRGTW